MKNTYIDNILGTHNFTAITSLIYKYIYFIADFFCKEGCQNNTLSKLICIGFSMINRQPCQGIYMFEVKY